MLARAVAVAAPLRLPASSIAARRLATAACPQPAAAKSGSRTRGTHRAAAVASPAAFPRRSLLRGALLAASCPPAGLFFASPAPGAPVRPTTAAAAVAGMSSEAGGGGGVTQQGDTGAVVVYVTVPDQTTADKLSEALVSAHLAACVNIVPGLTSVYWWDGKVNRDSELLLIIKTRSSLLPTLTEQVKRLHPYDEPEVVALPIAGGSASYLQWLHGSTADPQVDKLPEKLQ